MTDLERQIDEWNSIDSAAIRDFIDGGNRLETIMEGIDDELEESDGSDKPEQPPPGDTDDEERAPPTPEPAERLDEPSPDGA